VRPEDVLNLQVRDFYMFGFNGAYRGKVAQVEQPYIQVKYPQAEVE